MGEVEENANTTVPTGATIHAHLTANYCNREYLNKNYWSAQEIQEWAANTPVTDVWVREQHAHMKQEVSDTYLRKEDAKATYYTIASATATHKALENAIGDVQSKTLNTVITSISQLRAEINNIIQNELIKSGNSGITKLIKISSADFANLNTMSDDTLYIITA